MPRTAQVNTYHFKCNYALADDPEPLTHTKYFRTMDDVSKFVGCCRSTIYNRMKGPDPTIERGDIKVTGVYKLENPLPVYQKIMVHFD